MLYYWWWYITLGLISYLIGGINFAVILSRIKNIDIKNNGSRNPGTLNMYRCCGNFLGSFTFVLDALKGAICALIGLYTLGQFGVFYGGLFCAIGHIFTLYYKFKGGKGIAVTFGMFFVANYIMATAMLLILILYLLIFKHGAVGTLMSITILTIAECVLVYPEWKSILCMLSIIILIYIKHITNIKNIKNSHEKIFSLRKGKIKRF